MYAMDFLFFRVPLMSFLSRRKERYFFNSAELRFALQIIWVLMALFIAICRISAMIRRRSRRLTVPLQRVLANQNPSERLIPRHDLKRVFQEGEYSTSLNITYWLHVNLKPVCILKGIAADQSHVNSLGGSQGGVRSPA